MSRPLLGWTLQAFADCQSVDDIILIGSETDMPRLREIGQAFGGGKVRRVVLGGADRQASVRNGLAACPDADYIIVHDGARPCVTPALIEGVLSAAYDIGGNATVAIPVSDTLVKEGFWYTNAKGEQVGQFDERTPRDGLWAVQTPQAFDADGLRDAHKKAVEENFAATDDTAIYQKYNITSGWLLVGSADNIKVTRPEDLTIVEAVLTKRYGLKAFPTFRIGYGYDVHPFAPASENRTLYMGGVAFPEAERGLAGHSDADVLLHALCDALLGAAGMGDIGQLFPPSDNRHKNRASIEFLQEVAARLTESGWLVANVDMTVIAEAPKINPRVQQMKSKIGVVLNIGPTEVGIKATTSEGLGFVGRGEGIAAHATALLMRP